MGLKPAVSDAAARAAADFPANRFTCHQQSLEAPTELAHACQNRPGTPDVVMWGDSLALAWQPYAYAQRGVAADYSRDSCPPFDVGDATRRERWCTDFNALVLPRAQTAKTVILAARWVSYSDVSRLEATLRALSRQHIVIIGPSPALPASVPDCIALHDMHPCTLSRAEFNASTAATRNILKRLAAQYRATYVEPADFFCNATACPAVKDGVALYWDKNHVSSSAARAFAQRELQRLAL